MRAGDLDTRLQLFQPVLTKDSLGQDVETWQLAATVWGQPIPISGRERMTSAREVSEFDMRFRIRYRDGIDTTWRVGYEGGQFDIYSVAEIGRDEGLEILGKRRG